MNRDEQHRDLAGAAGVPSAARDVADAAGAVPARVALTLEDVRDKIAALRMRGFDEVRIVRTLASEGIDAVLVQRARAELDEGERRLRRRQWTIGVGAGGALAFACFVLDHVLGSQRSFGAILGVAFLVMTAIGLFYLVGNLRER